MADIRRSKFAGDVTAELKVRKLSLRDAQTQFKGVTAGLLSKIGNEHAVSAENMLAVCHHLKLNPFDYLDIDSPNIRNKFAQRRKIIEPNQGVAVDVSVKQPHHAGKFTRRACVPFPKGMDSAAKQTFNKSMKNRDFA